MPLGVHSAALGSISQGRTGDLPVPVQKISRRAQGLRPRGAYTLLALTKCIVLPSVHHDAVGAPFLCIFRGSIPGPPFPLSTLRLYPYGHLRMTRGRCGWLCLHRTLFLIDWLRFNFQLPRTSLRKTGVKKAFRIYPNRLWAEMGKEDFWAGCVFNKSISRISRRSYFTH